MPSEKASDRNVAAQFTLELGFESATSATADPTETLPQSPAETTTLFAFRDEFQNYGDAYARGDGSFQPTAPTDNFLSSAPNLGRDSTFNFRGRIRAPHRNSSGLGAGLGYAVQRRRVRHHPRV